MRDRTAEHLVAGSRALMKVGSPVRQWIHTLEHKSKTWLTPVRYAVPSRYASGPSSGPQYVEVIIAEIMPPYAIVYHHNGRQWVRLWLDTREVHLRPTGG
jgi:hypothetical protein